MASAKYEPLYLTNSAASNVMGRPDRGSAWLAIPTASVYGEITIKKEHNASFSVVVLANGLPSATANGVTSVKTTIDIGIYEIGLYSNTFDLQTTTEIRAYAPGGRKKWNVSGGFVQARDATTLIFFTTGVSRAQGQNESRSQKLQELRTIIDDAMDTMESSESSKHDKVLARQVAEVTFPTFADVALQ